MAIAELSIPRTEKGVLPPTIWCNKKNLRDMLQNDPTYVPATLDCDLYRIPDEVRFDLGVQPQVDQHKTFQIFRGDIEEGRDEARVLKSYDPTIPIDKIHSTTPGAKRMKVRTVWATFISEWPYSDPGWGWANYVNPTLSELADNFTQWIGRPEFLTRYSMSDPEGNRKRAELLIGKGDALLDEYLRSFEIMLKIKEKRFTKIIAPHYGHFLEHFIIDRSEYAQENAA